jgi:hypothetical protein
MDRLIDRRHRLLAGGVAIGEIDYFVLFPDLGFSIPFAAIHGDASFRRSISSLYQN